MLRGHALGCALVYFVAIGSDLRHRRGRCAEFRFETPLSAVCATPGTQGGDYWRLSHTLSMAAHQHAHGSSEEQEGLSAAVLELAKGLDAALGVRAVADDRKQSHDSIAAFWKTQLQGLGSWYERGDKYWSVRICPLCTATLRGIGVDVAPSSVSPTA